MKKNSQCAKKTKSDLTPVKKKNRHFREPKKRTKSQKIPVLSSYFSYYLMSNISFFPEVHVQIIIMMTMSILQSFPQRLHFVLDHCEQQGRTDIISWENNGTAFRVNNLEEFERDLLPRCFNTNKYNTFTRGLHSYGFTCVRAGRQTGICKYSIFT